MLHAQQSSTEVTFDSLSGFLTFIHFCVVSLASVKQFFLLFLHFLSSLSDSYPFLPGSKGESISNKYVCKESRAICSVTTLWHWYHIMRCKRCALKKRSCHAATPGNMSELLLTCLVPCCKSYTNLQSSLSSTIRIRGSERQEGMGDIDFLQVLRKISCVMEDFLRLVMMPNTVLFLELNFPDEQFTFQIVVIGYWWYGKIHFQYLEVTALQLTEAGRTIHWGAEQQELSSRVVRTAMLLFVG